MPELPEVQTLIDNLIDEDILNLKILKVDIFLEKLIKNKTPEEFKKIIINQEFKSIERIGKYLIFKLSNNKIMMVHLRMEGKIFIDDYLGSAIDKHTLLVIWFKNKKMIYNDTRKFGTFHIYNEDDYLTSKELSKVAIDPLDKNFNWKFLKNSFEKTNKYIKTGLLDQSKVSGIGNIYADEILFASQVSPLKKAKDLMDHEWKKIALNATKILKLAIDNKGTTIFSYLYKKNAGGEFQQFLQVHLQKNMPCKKCKTTITKIKVNGRGTYYCAKCQK